MNFFYRSSGIFILLMLISGKSLAQNIEIDISGCRAMYYILTAMKEGAPEQKVTTLLDSVLKTKPYQAMFRHYNRS
jgi:hypothetical protein